MNNAERSIWTTMAAVETVNDLTDMQALQAACAFAGAALRKIGGGAGGGMRVNVDPWPGLHVEISTDSEDGTASVTFTWKTASPVQHGAS